MSKRAKKNAAGPTGQVGKTEPGQTLSRLLSYVAAHPLRLFVLLVALGTLRIAATYTVFNHTIDEPAHIACGLQLVAKHVYTLEPQHPPLARVLCSIGPYLDGARLPAGHDSMYRAGALALYSGGDYARRLTLARLGILPFFWIGAAVVFQWARRYYGPQTAALATLLFTFLPPVLAHAGLATTDMALTAFTLAAFYSALVFAERPGVGNGLMLGATCALAVLSKFSALAFLPVAVGAAAAVYLCHARQGIGAVFGRLRRWPIPLAAAVALACLTVWAAYGFSYGPVQFGAVGPVKPPAPELFRGIADAQAHFSKGHPAYLLGERSQSGWWYYYFVVLGVKTPLAFLLLLAAGTAVALRRVPRGWIPLVFSAAILVFAMFNRINIGVRHILPVYAGFSIVAALGVLELLRARPRWAVAAGVVCLAWYGLASALSHPDYLAYTNELVGREPEKILADSDLDWGQDMDRVGKRLRELGAPQVAFAPFILADLSQHGWPPVTSSDPQMPTEGWNAVSITVWKVARMGLTDQYPNIQLWPDLVKPQERVGNGMLLYYFPPRVTR